MPIILNRQELATNELRKDALEILEAGLEAINTEKILRKKLKLEDGVLSVDGESFNLQSFNKIIFVGIGKCALDGAKVIEDMLGDYLTNGAVIDVKPVEEASELKRVKYFQGTHPYPSEQNVEATKQILDMVKNLTENDLVICLISGGGSALFDLPDEAATAKLGLPGETSLETIVRVTKELTAKGADIYELNNFRKSVSQVKGGKFAKLCQPAQIISLIFSDVLGNDISVIASGPTVLPSPGQGEGGVGFGGGDRVKNILVVSNADALEAMEEKALELGYDTTIETDRFSGDAEEKGKELSARDVKPRSCILLGGETTLKIRGDGTGGRNQAMALAALPHIKSDSVLICAASDGWDNTDHAGAIADAELLQKTKELNLNPGEYLEKSDSYNFFKKVGGGIYTGKLGSNVSDLCIILYK